VDNALPTRRRVPLRRSPRGRAGGRAVIRWCGDLQDAAAAHVRDRLPWRRIPHELTHARTGPQGPPRRCPCESRSDPRGWVACKDVRAAVSAEPLLSAVVRPPHAQPVLAHDDPERVRTGMGVRRRGRAASTLAAPSMAVARGQRAARTPRIARRRSLQPPVRGRRAIATSSRTRRSLRSLSREAVVSTGARTRPHRTMRSCGRRRLDHARSRSELVGQQVSRRPTRPCGCGPGTF
jgi:hypothetical protein